MGQNDDSDGEPQEEIEGAPPALSRAELRQRLLSETVALNRYLYQCSRELEYQLVAAQDLDTLLDVLLVDLPRHFSFPASELWLLDPDDALENLVPSVPRYGRDLRLLRDPFDLQELYGKEAEIALIDATDSRMFEVLKFQQGINYALLMPLVDGGQVVGSLHWGLRDDAFARADAEGELIGHLARVISISLGNCISRQRLTRLSVVDPLTEIGNRRGFETDLDREIVRARRSNQALTLLLLEIDDFEDLQRYHGSSTCEHVLRKVAARVASDLRGTDLLARVSDARLAVLLPGAGESLAADVAERMRADVEDFQVDNGRGGVMHATLSIGLATWEPQRYPAVELAQLARQLESAARKGLAGARAREGNQLQISRLSALMI